MKERFIGVWKLISCESKNQTTGEVSYPFGRNPVGRLTYDAAGRVSAQLMNPGRRTIGGPPTRPTTAVARDASPEDMREILAGFLAYFGTFDIDESSHTVIHHVQACLVPSWVGTDLRRAYQFVDSGQLILTASFDQAHNRLVWQRERD